MRIGIMQGRLLPPEPERLQAFPRTRWQQEFALAAAAGLDSIEWIYDLYGEDVNPIATAEGIQAMQRLAVAHDVSVVSLARTTLSTGRRLIKETGLAAETLPPSRNLPSRPSIRRRLSHRDSRTGRKRNREAARSAA